MIRQAHTYLVGAMGGATLIAIAIAVFVMLVSAQVFTDWPLAALGGEDKAAVSEAQPASDSGSGVTVQAAATGAAAAKARGGDDRANAVGARDGASLAANGGVDGAGAESVTTGQRGDGGGNPAQGGGGAGSAPGDPGQGASAPASGDSGNASGGGGGNGGAVSSGGGKSTAGTGGGGSSGGSTTTTGQVTETVNNTVNQVDETALGGTLNETGVTEVTEGVVNGVVGPESTVGKVVDETVGAVGGLLRGNR